MGHWSATTLGNDTAWDAVGALTACLDTPEIRAALDAAFAPPDGDVYDEAACAEVLALAELVAAGLRAPSPELRPAAKRWAAAYRHVLAPYRDAARGAAARAARSPYASMWVRPEGAAAFAASAGDLDRRLAEAAVPRAPSPKVRFLRRLHELARADGWALRASDALLVRAIPGGEHRVRCCLSGRHGLWTCTLEFEVAHFAPQLLVQTAAGHPDHGKRSCVVRGRPARERYSPTGKVWRLILHAQGVTVPPKAALDAAGLSVADVRNPDATVFAAAARAMEIVRADGEAFFAAWPDLEALRPAASRRDLDELRRLCPIGCVNNWFGVAWGFDPAWGRDLLAQQRARAAEAGGRYAVEQAAILDRIEAALEAATPGRRAP